MIDLDDATLIRQYDRNGLLDRAAQPQTRLSNARNIARRWLEETPAPMPGADTPIAICLPPELIGIGQIATTLVAAAGSKRPLLTRVDDAAFLAWPAVTYYVAPGAHAPATGAPEGAATSPVCHLPPAFTGDLHPVESLLTLLIILDALGTVDDSALLPLADLRSCHPEIPIASNPAKQLAIRFHERIPLFWGSGIYEGIAADWKMRYLWYAEQIALNAAESGLSRLLVMARFPRYLANSTLLAHIHQAGAASPQSLRLKRLLERRRFSIAEITAPAHLDLRAAACYLLELGEWVALYASALYNVDPADRVPLEWLASVL